MKDPMPSEDREGVLRVALIEMLGSFFDHPVGGVWTATSAREAVIARARAALATPDRSRVEGLETRLGDCEDALATVEAAYDQMEVARDAVAAELALARAALAPVETETTDAELDDMDARASGNFV